MTAIFKNSLLLALTLLVLACAPAPKTPPTPFETGKEVAPPIGCIEYRERGGQC